MKKIPLTKGKFAIVDDEDYDRLMKYKWHESNGYAIRVIKRKPRKNGKKSKSFLMHRVIMKARRGQFIDHKNIDKLDNRKENLRFCTPQQNAFNFDISRNNKTGYKGVHMQPNGTYIAIIYVDGKARRLGLFSTAKEAGEAYDKVALKHFGEFARTNAMIHANRTMNNPQHI